MSERVVVLVERWRELAKTAETTAEEGAYRECADALELACRQEPEPIMPQLLIDSLRQQVAILTEALGKYGQHFGSCDVVECIGSSEPLICSCGYDAVLAAVREPVTYVRCTCDHPGDTPACDVDHDQIQHEREKIG